MRSPVGRFDLTASQVVAWIEAEANSPSGAADCIRLIPPEDVEIVNRVGTRSYQKRVYRAIWDASGRRQEIVLKEFLGNAAVVIPREMQAYPLSMLHPNIIQTYRLENPLDADRPFLAERMIHPLDEGWEPGGIGEAALVLTDLARALAFLAEQNLVHGDIKPDNIGYDRGSYLLLDFGVARKREAFAELPEPTGTLSTRAPEVILGVARQTPQSDVYALAACIFCFLYRRYPLVGSDDEKGEPKSPERREYVAALKERLASGWVGEMEFLARCEHFGLRMLLRDMLNPNPRQRPTADQVLKRALKELPALVGTPVGPLFRASDELQQ
jgi:serine/threonine protein kinase